MKPWRHARSFAPVAGARVDQDGATAASQYPRLERDDHPAGVGLPVLRSQPVRVVRPHFGIDVGQKLRRRQERLVPFDDTDDLDITQHDVSYSIVATHEGERTPMRGSSA